MEIEEAHGPSIFQQECDVKTESLFLILGRNVGAPGDHSAARSAELRIERELEYSLRDTCVIYSHLDVGTSEH
ncbi:hypothetical protein D9M68_714660 [compost metagenome]